MAKNDVMFRVTMDEANMFRSMQRVISAQRKMEGGVKKTSRAMKTQKNAFKGMSRSLMSMAAAGVGGYGIGMMARDLFESSKRAAGLRDEFEKMMTPLTSLGNNIDHLASLKQEVLDLSSAWGIGVDQITRFAYAAQSSASNLDPEIIAALKRESIELTEVYGGALPSNLLAITKLYQNYGKGLKDVARLQNMVAKTIDKGAFTAEQLAEFLPDVVPVAKIFGYSPEELLGAASTASRLMGSPQKAMTGLRNVFLKLKESLEAGEQFTDNMVENFRRLNSLSPETMVKAFGRRSVAVAAALSGQTTSLKSDIDNLTVSLEAYDVVGTKMTKRLADADARRAVMNRVLTQSADAQTLKTATGGPQWHQDINAAKLDWRKIKHPDWHGGLFEKAYAHLWGSMGGSAPVKAGHAIAARNLRKGGRHALAAAHEKTHKVGVFAGGRTARQQAVVDYETRFTPAMRKKYGDKTIGTLSAAAGLIAGAKSLFVRASDQPATNYLRQKVEVGELKEKAAEKQAKEEAWAQIALKANTALAQIYAGGTAQLAAESAAMRRPSGSISRGGETIDLQANTAALRSLTQAIQQPRGGRAGVPAAAMGGRNAGIE